MPKVVQYLDCGCAILEGGGRTWCPTHGATDAAPRSHMPEALREIHELEAEIVNLRRERQDTLTREDTLVVSVVRWMEMAEGSPKWQHLDETDLLALMAEEMNETLAPYESHAETNQ